MKFLISNINWELNKEYNFDKLLYLLINRPDKILKCYDGNYSYIWIDYYGKWVSKYDLPAIEYSNGTKEWWHNGKPHRKNGKLSAIL